MKDQISHDYIWLMSLILKYEQEHNDNKAKDFWNWCMDTYTPDGFERIED